MISHQDANSHLGSAAYFVFDNPESPKETFVFKIDDPRKIQEARDILNGKQKDRVHVTGIIVKTCAPYNAMWSFHYEPESISFFEIAAEVCDASIKYVEEHLAEVGGSFLPRNRWCPWGSRLLKEITWP
jgi:hypothetical protein